MKQVHSELDSIISSGADQVKALRREVGTVSGPAEVELEGTTWSERERIRLTWPHETETSSLCAGLANTKSIYQYLNK